jgi:2-C-methyl-D-erythritol 4-phosphate cytidylyltransferase
MGEPKQLLELAGKPIAAWSLAMLAQTAAVTEIVIACEPDDLGNFEQLALRVAGSKVRNVVRGGARRQDSIFAALRSLNSDSLNPIAGGDCQVAPPDLIVVHDGARPFMREDVLNRVIETARELGGAIAAVPVKDTIKQANENETVLKTIPRERLWSAQTPQAFGYELLYRAHESAETDGFMGTDDAELVERLGGVTIGIVESSYENLKITTPEDLIVAERIAAGLTERSNLFDR